MTDLAFMKFKILVTDHKCLEALELVSPEQHKVFTTYYADPVKGYKHVAADLGISIGTVKSRLHRARQKIIAMRAQQEVKNEQATSQGTASTANQDTAAFPFTEGGE